MTTYVGPGRIWTETPGALSSKDAWGPPMNSNMSLLQVLTTGLIDIDLTGKSAYTLTVKNGAADEARPAFQTYIGTPTGTCTVTLPNVERIGFTRNNTSNQNVVLKSGGGPTATVPPANRYWPYATDGGGGTSLVSLGAATLRTTDTVIVGTDLEVGNTLTVSGLFNQVRRGRVSSGATGVAAVVFSEGAFATVCNALALTVAGTSTPVIADYTAVSKTGFTVRTRLTSGDVAPTVAVDYIAYGH